MAPREVVTVTGQAVQESAIQALEVSLRGQLLRSGDDGYDTARKVWNGMVDGRPALIARCAGAADVITAVNFGRDNGLLVAVRGGGHNAAGNAVCDGGLVIDLSLMRGVRVDPKGRTVRAAGGATLGDVDRETAVFGLATVLGTVSATGIGGLTLGGGIGWLMRKHGLACDNLLSADVVTADGRLLVASDSESPDLFWGIRGGGGNFGVVTSFEYRLHPVGPVVGGVAIHPLARAREVLRFFQEYTAGAPDELTAMVIFMTDPEGNPALALVACYAGDVEKGERVLKPVKEFGPPVEDMIDRIPYMQIQTMFDGDPSSQPGFLNYLKSDFLKGLSDDAIDAMVEYFHSCPSPLSIAGVEHMGGAIRRLGPDDTAFAQRDADYNFVAWSCWDNPAESDRQIAWARDFWSALQPVSAGGVYQNYMGEEGEDRVRAAYGATYQRLTALKGKYDPRNFFRLNQNIQPTV